MEESKKNGAIWYEMIMEKIKKKKEWMDTYNKIPLKFQPTVLKMFVEDLPKLEYIQEYEKYFDTKIEKVYNENINKLEGNINRQAEIMKNHAKK